MTLVEQKVMELLTQNELLPTLVEQKVMELLTQKELLPTPAPTLPTMGSSPDSPKRSQLQRSSAQGGEETMPAEKTENKPPRQITVVAL